jgi:hypothetical protein
MRMKLFPLSLRETADTILRRMCREDGMSWLRAWYVYWSVRLFVKSAATKPQEVDTQIIEAP